MRTVFVPSALPDIVARAREITALAVIEMPTTPLTHGDGRGGTVVVERTIPQRVEAIAAKACTAIADAYSPMAELETLTAAEIAGRLPLLDAAIDHVDVFATVVLRRLKETRSKTAALADDLAAAQQARAEAEAEAQRRAEFERRVQDRVDAVEAERLRSVEDQVRAELATTGKGK